MRLVPHKSAYAKNSHRYGGKTLHSMVARGVPLGGECESINERETKQMSKRESLVPNDPSLCWISWWRNDMFA
jgi:hypothetical protein